MKPVPAGALGAGGDVRVGARRVVQGSASVMSAYGASQLLRLGSNLILTRLLVPEAFGVMALVAVFMQAVEMMSDVGAGASVTHSKRGGDDTFLATAWSVQAVRGVALWLMSCAAAWPMAVGYDAPALLYVLPIAGLKSLLLGIRSSKAMAAQRKVYLGRLMTLEVASQFASTVLMVAWALVSPTVWALVAGGMVSAALKCAGTFFLFPGKSVAFGWDKGVLEEMVTFGRWIFIATLATFLLQQGDRAVAGAIVELSVLGVYSIAIMWTRMPIEVALRIGSRVLFPALARVKDADPRRLRGRNARARLMLLGLLLPPLLMLAVAGDFVMALLYDPPFEASGWMVRILAPGFCVGLVSVTAGNALLALGDSFGFMCQQVARGFLVIIAMFVGMWLGGFPGLIVGVAASKMIEYPILAFTLSRHKMWQPEIDLPAIALSLTCAGVGWMIAPPEIIW